MKVKEVNEKIQKAKEISRIVGKMHEGENMNISYDLACDICQIMTEYRGFLENSPVGQLYD